MGRVTLNSIASGKLEVESSDHFHLLLNEIFIRSGDVETSINPDDTRSSSQGKTCPETFGNTHCTVGVEKFKMNSMAGEAKHNQNSSFVLNVYMKCKDWTKDVSLSVGKWRLDSLEDIRDVSLKSCEALLNQCKTSRA